VYGCSPLGGLTHQKQTVGKIGCQEAKKKKPADNPGLRAKLTPVARCGSHLRTTPGAPQKRTGDRKGALAAKPKKVTNGATSRKPTFYPVHYGTTAEGGIKEQGERKEWDTAWPHQKQFGAGGSVISKTDAWTSRVGKHVRFHEAGQEKNPRKLEGKQKKEEKEKQYSNCAPPPREREPFHPYVQHSNAQPWPCPGVYPFKPPGKTRRFRAQRKRRKNQKKGPNGRGERETPRRQTKEDRTPISRIGDTSSRCKMQEKKNASSIKLGGQNSECLKKADTFPAPLTPPREACPGKESKTQGREEDKGI